MNRFNRIALSTLFFRKDNLKSDLENDNDELMHLIFEENFPSFVDLGSIDSLV